MTNASGPVLQLWRAIGQRDWAAVKSVVSHDYWDLNAIANTTWFQSSLAAPDLSWVFGATGLI